MSRIVAITAPRPGTGATTMTITVAHALSLAGEATLIVDLDPHAAATIGLGVAQANSGVLAGLVAGETPATKIGMLVRSVDAGLDIIPGDVTMTQPPREAPLALGQALDVVRPQYPWILVDCPPSERTLTRSALAAADAVIVPVPAELMGLDGAQELLTLTDEVAELRHKSLDVRGLVLTMYRDEKPLCEQVRQDLHRRFGDLAFSTVVPWDAAVAEAAGFGKTVLRQALESRAARAYVQLSKELMDHVG